MGEIRESTSPSGPRTEISRPLRGATWTECSEARGRSGGCLRRWRACSSRTCWCLALKIRCWSQPDGPPLLDTTATDCTRCRLPAPVLRARFLLAPTTLGNRCTAQRRTSCPIAAFCRVDGTSRTPMNWNRFLPSLEMSFCISFGRRRSVERQGWGEWRPAARLSVSPEASLRKIKSQPRTVNE